MGEGGLAEHNLHQSIHLSPPSPRETNTEEFLELRERKDEDEFECGQWTTVLRKHMLFHTGSEDGTGSCPFLVSRRVGWRRGAREDCPIWISSGKFKKCHSKDLLRSSGAKETSYNDDDDNDGTSTKGSVCRHRRRHRQEEIQGRS